MSDELVVIEESTVLTAFTSKQGLDPLVQQARELVDGFEHEMGTSTGRARTASLAAKVAKFKTRLDGMGKDLVADWKNKAKVVDASRKSMRDALDELKIEARRPLTEWEEAEAQKVLEEAAKQAQIQIDNEHELGLLLDEKFDKERAEAGEKLRAEQAAEVLRIEAERVARDEKIALDARVKAEAEAKQQLEQAQRDKEQAEERRIQAEADAKAQAEEVERQRVRAADQAEKDQAAAVERAAQRERDLQSQRAEEARIAQEKLEANKKHVGEIRKAAKESLMKIVDEETAKKIVLAISKDQIANVSIKY